MSTTSSTYTLGNSGLATVPLASGELLISGYLTRWDELDDTGDRMVRGAFVPAIPAFLKGHAPLCLSHRFADVLGKVISLEEDDTGVKMMAKVMKQPESSPLRWAYDAIRGGYMRGLSAMARWKKAPLPDGTRGIVGIDTSAGRGIVECSVTPMPALQSTAFEVISEGKALAMLGAPSLTHDDAAAAVARLELHAFEREIDAIRLDGYKRAARDLVAR